MYCLRGRYLNAGGKLQTISLIVKFKSAVISNVCTEWPEQIIFYYMGVKDLNLLAHKLARDKSRGYESNGH